VHLLGLVLKNLSKSLPNLFQVLLVTALLVGQVAGVMAGGFADATPIKSMHNVNSSTDVMTSPLKVPPSGHYALVEHDHSTMPTDSASHCVDATDCEACVFCSAAVSPFQLIASYSLPLFHDQQEPHFPSLFLDIPQTPPILSI